MLRKECVTLPIFILPNRWGCVRNHCYQSKPLLIPARQALLCHQGTKHSHTITAPWSSSQPVYDCEPAVGSQQSQKTEIAALLLSPRVSQHTMRCQRSMDRVGRFPSPFPRAHHLLLTFTRTVRKGYSFPGVAM